ncbi:MAG: Hsp20/alpha crystallin family protein [Ignavibacteriae bacterium]|nr:Hsp20/alpha crystallin family protein [Ignavibacteriota bacterium]
MLVQVRRRPAFGSFWNEISEFEREINKVFGNIHRDETATGHQLDRYYSPAIAAWENDDHTALMVELPGVKKEDLKLSVENNVLTVTGSRKRHATPEKSTWLRNEIRTGDFSRTVRLPQGVDTTKISAELANGVLRVVLPKAEEVKPREIRIN